MSSGFISYLKSLFSGKSDHLKLKHYTLFHDLASYDLFLISQLMHERSFKAGETLFEEGYPLEVVFFIESGEVEIAYLPSKQYTAVVRKHQLIGMIDMFNDNRRSCSAKALKPSKLLTISRLDLEQLINSNPRAGIKIMNAFCRIMSKLYLESVDPRQEN